jgi:hypothetical protein
VLSPNAGWPRIGRCLLFAPKPRTCTGCRTIQWCKFYDRQGTTMNYLNLISLILTLGVDDLPQIEVLIARLKNASPAHIATINKVVNAALTTAAV